MSRSATWGIVSNLRGSPRLPSRRLARRKGGQTLHHYGTLIQTDAKLELGTSGGALINLKGEMVGLTTRLAALVGYERQAALRFRSMRSFARPRAAQGRPHAGVRLSRRRPTLLGMEQRQQGNAGPASWTSSLPPSRQRASKGEDIITHVDGQPIADDLELIRRLERHARRSSVNLTVFAAVARANPAKRTSPRWFFQKAGGRSADAVRRGGRRPGAACRWNTPPAAPTSATRAAT